MNQEQVTKSQFKVKALEYFRKVEVNGGSLVVTDHGEPMIAIRRYRSDSRSPLEHLRLSSSGILSGKSNAGAGFAPHFKGTSMKNYLWAALSVVFVAAGLMTFFFIATKGHVEGALSDRGVPVILDIGGAFLMIGMGGLGLKAFWDEIPKKNDTDKDDT